MKHIDYWLDALPPEAPERELLAAAERDFPPPGSIDRSWNALCAAAAITSGAVAISSSAAASVSPAVAISGSAAASVSPAVTSAVSASSATGASVTVLGNAAASASATALGNAAASAPLLVAGKGAILASSAAASGVAASATTSVGFVGLSVAAKSIAVGFAIGLGALGTGQLVQSIHRNEPAPLASLAEASRHASRLRSAVRVAPRRVSAAQNEAAPANELGSTNESANELTNQSEQANLERANGHTNPFEPANGLVNRLERVNDSEQGKIELDGAPISVADLARRGSNKVNTADVRSADVRSASSAKNADGKSVNSESEPTRSSQQQRDEVDRKQSGAPSQLAEIPLSQQAAELARIKGLLDSGAPSEALIRLRACLDAHALSAIAEDRDALYIEALKRTGHHAEAKRAASNFYVRYPNSPQRDRIGELVAGE